MIITQSICFVGFYCVDKTIFYTIDCETAEFYFDFTMDIDYENAQSHFCVKKKIMTQYLIRLYLFRSGDFFLERARERINERRTHRATAETRFLTARKDKVWSNRVDKLGMDEIKYRINKRIAGFTKHPDTDCRFMGMWLGRSRQDCYVDSGFLPLDDVMPLGAPVIDFMRVDKAPGWLGLSILGIN